MEIVYEDQVVREDDDLPFPCFPDKTRSDPLFAVMVKRRDRIIENDADIVEVDADLGQKIGEGNGSLLAFA